MQAGDSYWLRNHEDEREHLYIAVSGPDAEGRMLFFNLTQYYPIAREGHYQDTTCTLVCGEHPSMSKPSVIAYKWAALLSDEDLRRHEELGLLRPAKRAPPALVKKILAGAKTTNSLPLKFYRHVGRPLPSL